MRITAAAPAAAITATATTTQIIHPLFPFGTFSPTAVVDAAADEPGEAAEEVVSDSEDAVVSEGTVVSVEEVVPPPIPNALRSCSAAS